MTLSDKKTRLMAAYRNRSKDDPLTFILGLRIPAASGPTQFSRCVADFQREALEEIAPNLLTLREGKKPAKRRFWWERTKGGSKDSDIGACLLWSVAFAKRPTFIQVGAADKDQAGIVKRRIEDLLYYNDWLNKYVRVHNYRILTKPEPLAVVDIVAADVAGSHGETPDILVLNELSHVTKWEFIQNLIDNARKVPQGIIIAATNAGFKGSQAEMLRRTAIDSKSWSVRILNKPAPWISEEDLEEAKLTSGSKTRYMRLWHGVWASGKGEALDEEDLDGIFKKELKEQTKPLKGWRYIGGLDLGISHDHAGIAILGVNCDEQKIRVATLRDFAPSKRTKEVDLIAVEETLLGLSKTFHCEWIGYDPHQAKLMAQRLIRRYCPLNEVSFGSPKNLQDMAEGLIQVVESRVLESYEDERLRRDFGKFSIVERPQGHKLEAVSDEYGHADVGTALAIAIPKAIQMLGISFMLGPEDAIGFIADDELTKEDIEDMPEEFKEILQDDTLGPRSVVDEFSSLYEGRYRDY